ncbi:MAG TPA: type 4a pilus biogenesis protein PilO [Myxococcales bacterium]|jgi:type IV pilus assembly protein PilO|nr:type 4a pilus biogenesis protein PilO [Myxococcales bacterium]
MGNLFDRIASTQLSAKVGLLLAVLGLLGGGYWYFFYSDLLDEKEQLVQEAEKLTKEKKEYEKRKAEYLAFRNEVNSLLEEQKELLRVLPKRDDIEQFIENVQAQIELSGLSKVSSIREAAQPVEMYVKIPIRMSLLGTYHQINRFFKNVGDLKRIVNIEDLSLAPASVAEGPVTPTNSTNLLKANFLATTFQFVDKGRGGPAKGGTNISAGGGH